MGRHPEVIAGITMPDDVWQTELNWSTCPLDSDLIEEETKRRTLLVLRTFGAHVFNGGSAPTKREFMRLMRQARSSLIFVKRLLEAREGALMAVGQFLGPTSDALRLGPMLPVVVAAIEKSDRVLEAVANGEIQPSVPGLWAFDWFVDAQAETFSTLGKTPTARNAGGSRPTLFHQWCKWQVDQLPRRARHQYFASDENLSAKLGKRLQHWRRARTAATKGVNTSK